MNDEKRVRVLNHILRTSMIYHCHSLAWIHVFFVQLTYVAITRQTCIQKLHVQSIYLNTCNMTLKRLL